jgi:hypothetical protein
MWGPPRPVTGIALPFFIILTKRIHLLVILKSSLVVLQLVVTLPKMAYVTKGIGQIIY